MVIPSRSARAGLHALFFASGALGLVYEVLWMRRFTVLFGGTAQAGAATLSGFFLGTAVGSLVFGRRSRRWTRPVLGFGLLEIGVALGALGAMAALELYRPMYPSLHATFASTPGAFLAVKLLLAIVAIGLPAFFMGGTLPALAEAVTPGGTRPGVPVAGLYAANLLGAVAGSLAVPFVLLPRLGAAGAYALAVTASSSVGLVAAVAGVRLRRQPIAATESRGRGTTVLAPPRIDARLLLLSAFSGASTLGLQVLWTRAFALVHESSVYAFALVVAVFLVALAGGAALARRGLQCGVRPRLLLGVAWWTGGTLVVVSPLVFARLTRGLAYVTAPDWPSLVVRLAGLALVVLLPATLALGMALPLLIEMAGSESSASAGPLTGALVAANTLGAIVGPLVAAFLLAPTLGLWRSLGAIGCLVALAGSWTGLGRRLGVAAALAVAVAAGVLEAAAPPPARVRGDRGERLVSVREGSYGTTAVIEDAHDRWITVNNAYVLGGSDAAAEERWQAHLPLLLHPAPRRVAFLGLGTGITAGASLVHPVETVVALELVPDVVAAAREDFGELNHGLLADPRVSVVTDDGRNYLAAGVGPFDVIVQDLLVPWRPGEASLYTREHLETVRRALTQDGIFCQWLPVYQLSERELRVVVATFLDVFPRTTLWRGNFLADQPVLALVGHRSSLPLDPQRIDDGVRSLAGRLDPGEAFLRDPAGLWLSLVGPMPPTLAWLADAPRDTDAEPWLEILGPVAHAEGRTAAFARGALQDVLSTVSDQPLAGTPLASLDRERIGWRRTGMALARASRVPGRAGEAGVQTLLETLPRPIQEALGL